MFVNKVDIKPFPAIHHRKGKEAVSAAIRGRPAHWEDFEEEKGRIAKQKKKERHVQGKNCGWRNICRMGKPSFKIGAL